MGAWGIGLYSADFAQDLKAAMSAVCRLPLAEDELVDAICQSQASAAGNPEDADHTVFWLVLADQFEKRRIFSRRVRQTALAIIDEGRDAAMMQSLGMQPGDIRKRAVKLAELRARLVVQSEASAARKTIASPQPYVFEQYGVYAYPVCGGKPINPYMPASRFDRAAWQEDGFGLLLVVSRGRAFGYLPWYVAVKAIEVLGAIPDRNAAESHVRWIDPSYGSCNAAHFRKMELREIGVFTLDPARIDHFFPHIASGTVYAVKDISIANQMGIGKPMGRRLWRRPDGTAGVIVYPPAPNLLELAAVQ